MCSSDLARLRDQLALTDRQCYETLEPITTPTIPAGGDYLVTVSPGDGRFPAEYQIGGGSATCVEETSVTVTLYTRTRTDQTDHAERLFHDETRGLMVLKQKVLKALVGHVLTDIDGNELLTQHLYAMQSWRPRVDQQSNLAMTAVGFGVDYNWDLT